MFVWTVLTFLDQMAEREKKEERTLTSTRPVGFAAGKNRKVFADVIRAWADCALRSPIEHREARTDGLTLSPLTF